MANDPTAVHRNTLNPLARPSRPRWGILFLLLMLGTMGRAWAATPQQREMSFDTTPAPRISLTNLYGRVIVRGWDQDGVRAVCTANSSRIAIVSDAYPPTGLKEKIQFVTQTIDPLVTGEDQRADYVLDVPRDSTVEIRNRQGSVQVENLHRDTWVETVGATVTAADLGGRFSARSVGGDIDVLRPAGEVQAHSITGNLHFISPSSSRVRGRTTSGTITYDGDFALGGDYALSAYSGDVDIFCPQTASFELRAKTVRGKLDNTLRITSRRQAATPLFSASSLVGIHNTGQARVELTSFSGTIRIRPRP